VDGGDGVEGGACARGGRAVGDIGNGMGSGSGAVDGAICAVGRSQMKFFLTLILFLGGMIYWPISLLVMLLLREDETTETNDRGQGTLKGPSSSLMKPPEGGIIQHKPGQTKG